MKIHGALGQGLSLRNGQELVNLGTVIDLMLDGKHLEALDILIGRFQVVETSAITGQTFPSSRYVFDRAEAGVAIQSCFGIPATAARSQPSLGHWDATPLAMCHEECSGTP